MSQINRFCNLRLKKYTFLELLHFLLDCRRNKFIPNIISILCNFFSSNRFDKVLFRPKLAFLRSLIQETRHKITHIERELHSLHINLANSTPYFESIDRMSWSRVVTDSSVPCSVLKKKFNTLWKIFFVSNFSNLSVINQNVVVNLSSVSLSDNQLDALKLNNNFSVFTIPSLPNLIAPIERAFPTNTELSVTCLF